jgi:hypothetical protein
MSRTVIKLRRGTAAEWTSSNEILNLGEPGFEKDTKKLKIGDGVTAWNDLQYVAGANGGDITLEDVDNRIVELLQAGDGINIEYDDQILTIRAVITDLLTSGEGIDFDYDEQTNTLTISSSVDTLLSAGQNIEFIYDEQTNNLTIGASGLSEIGHTHTLSDITDYQEKAYVNYFDFESNSVTNVVNSDTWYKLNTNTTSLFSNNGLIHSNNRVTNVNERSLIVQMEGIASLSANNNTEIHISFFKNDTLIPCAEQIETTSARGNTFFTSVIPFHCVTELEEDDYIEVWVKNKNTTDNITIANLNVIIKEL